MKLGLLPLPAQGRKGLFWGKRGAQTATGWGNNPGQLPFLPYKQPSLFSLDPRPQQAMGSSWEGRPELPLSPGGTQASSFLQTLPLRPSHSLKARNAGVLHLPTPPAPSLGILAPAPLGCRVGPLPQPCLASASLYWEGAGLGLTAAGKLWEWGGWAWVLCHGPFRSMLALGIFS